MSQLEVNPDKLLLEITDLDPEDPEEGAYVRGFLNLLEDAERMTATVAQRSKIVQAFEAHILDLPEDVRTSIEPRLDALARQT